MHMFTMKTNQSHVKYRTTGQVFWLRGMSGCQEQHGKVTCEAKKQNKREKKPTERCENLLTKFSDRRRTVAPNGADGTSWTHLKPDGTVKAKVGGDEKKNSSEVWVEKKERKKEKKRPLKKSVHYIHSFQNQLPPVNHLNFPHTHTLRAT